MQSRPVLIPILAAALVPFSAALADDRPARAASAPSASLMAITPVQSAGNESDRATPHAFRDRSMFAITPEPPRTFRRHDLVQILVRESSRAKSSQEADASKRYRIDGRIAAWPDLNLSDLLDFRVMAGRTANLPEVRVQASKDFSGDGEYKREDDFTTRLTAQVIEILPNGHLVLEARTHIRLDNETSTITLTGVCRPDDVTVANTILSSSIHDLRIEKSNTGELRRTTQKGLLSRLFDTVFAF